MFDGAVRTAIVLEVSMSFLGKLAISSTLALSIWATSTPAHSATIDFVALAASHEGAYSRGAYGGITFTAGALGNLYSTPYGSAGLGVCSTKNASCSGKSDGNVGNARDKKGASMETLRLAFDSPVTITGLAFNNRNHFALNMQELIIGGVMRTTNAGGIMSVSIALAANEYLTFTHSALGGKKASRARDFYLSSLTYVSEPSLLAVPQVPIPAALPLLAAALAGLVFLGRSRKRHPHA